MPKNQNKSPLPPLKELVQNSFGFFKLHFNGLLPLVAIAMGILFVFGIVTGLVSTFTGFSLLLQGRIIMVVLLIIFILLAAMLFIATLVFQALAHATLLKAIIKADRTKKVAPREWKNFWKEAYVQIKPIILLNILIVLILIGGYLLLFIPGLIFGVWYGFSVIFLLAENKKGKAALRASRELVRGYFWPIVWRLFVMIALIWLVSFAVSLIPFLGSVAGMALSLFVLPFMNIYTYLLYKDLKKLKGQNSLAGVAK